MLLVCGDSWCRAPWLVFVGLSSFFNDDILSFIFMSGCSILFIFEMCVTNVLIRLYDGEDNGELERMRGVVVHAFYSCANFLFFLRGNGIHLSTTSL